MQSNDWDEGVKRGKEELEMHDGEACASTTEAKSGVTVCPRRKKNGVRDDVRVPSLLRNRNNWMHPRRPSHSSKEGEIYDQSMAWLCPKRHG